jgi:hypothetical protein
MPVIVSAHTTAKFDLIVSAHTTAKFDMIVSAHPILAFKVIQPSTAKFSFFHIALQ